MAGFLSSFTMPVISLVLLSISATSIIIISMIPVYMRLLRHIPAVLRMCQGLTSGFTIIMMILAVWVKLQKISCQGILSLELFFMTSSLAWFILDNVDIALVTWNKSLTGWKSLLVAMTVGWGIGILPVLIVLLSVPDDLGLKNGSCWFGDVSHWSMAGVLFIGGVIELVTVNIATFALLKKRREEPDLKILPEKRTRILSSAVTYTFWTIVNCVGCLAMTSGSDILFYIHGALTLIFALLHGGLFVLGEYKINSRLSVVYRLLRLEPAPSPTASEPNPRPGTSQASRTNQTSPREVCRVPPLSKDGPKLGAVYRRKESEKQFNLKIEYM